MAARRRGGSSLLADVVAGSFALLREVARVPCSAALALACFLPLAAPLAWGGARLIVTGLARWAWELASQAAWEYLADRLLLTDLASPPPFAANTTLPGSVPAILLGARPSTGNDPDSGVCLDLVLLRFGGLAEDASQAPMPLLTPGSRWP